MNSPLDEEEPVFSRLLQVNRLVTGSPTRSFTCPYVNSVRCSRCEAQGT